MSYYPGNDALAKYKIADQDEPGTNINYYGFLAPSGSWYILKADTSANPGTYRYANGVTAYSTNWTNRATLTYSYLSSLTGL